VAIEDRHSEAVLCRVTEVTSLWSFGVLSIWQVLISERSRGIGLGILESYTPFVATYAVEVRSHSDFIIPAQAGNQPQRFGW
jgi:hypothetical protein